MARIVRNLLGAALGLAGLMGSAAAAMPAYTLPDADLRAGPGWDYPLVSPLPPGVPAEIFGCIEGWEWCDVEVQGLRGWIAGPQMEVMDHDERMAMDDYGPEFGVPIIGFDIGGYWGRFYHDRPFYAEHERWDRGQWDHGNPGGGNWGGGNWGGGNWGGGNWGGGNWGQGNWGHDGRGGWRGPDDRDGGHGNDPRGGDGRGGPGHDGRGPGLEPPHRGDLPRPGGLVDQGPWSRGPGNQAPGDQDPGMHQMPSRPPAAPDRDSGSHDRGGPPGRGDGGDRTQGRPPNHGPQPQ